MSDQVGALAYALSLVPKPVRHQPVLTRYGVDCICGVFCGRKLSSWKGHRADRMLLHSGDTFSNEPIPESLYALRKTAERTGRALAMIHKDLRAKMKSLSEAVARFQLRSGDDYTQA